MRQLSGRMPARGALDWCFDEDWIDDDRLMISDGTEAKSPFSYSRPFAFIRGKILGLKEGTLGILACGAMRDAETALEMADFDTPRMTRFRPCIDLHQGKVKQIVGGSLRDDGTGPRENFVSEQPAAGFAERFRADGLTGGHVIKLGPGNDEAAREALAAWPGGLQIGGGIGLGNAVEWLEAGASHVIVTSALFDTTGKFLEETLRALVAEIGRERLVIDLSCRRSPGGWTVAMNRWQTLTELAVDHATLDRLLPFCDEFLIHAADVEGLCGGIDAELVALLGSWGKIPVTYAGGAATMADLLLIEQAGRGAVDVTVGSALDLFGGNGLNYSDLVRWNGRAE